MIPFDTTLAESLKVYLTQTVRLSKNHFHPMFLIVLLHYSQVTSVCLKNQESYPPWNLKIWHKTSPSMPTNQQNYDDGSQID